MRSSLLLVAVLALVIPTNTRAAESDAILERAVDNYTKQMERMDAVLERAKEVHKTGADRAKFQLIAAYDLAVKRATKRGELANAQRLLAAKNKLEGKEGGVDVAVAPAIPDAAPSIKGLAKLDNRKFYHCVLGLYRQHHTKKPFPFITLTIPDGNLWSKEVQDHMRGKVDLGNMTIAGTAHLYIPADGVYTVNLKGSGLKINDLGINSGDITLKKGLHPVVYTASNYGQPHMRTAGVKVFKKGTEIEMPFVNTGAEIKTFISEQFKLHPVTMTHPFRPTEVRIR